MKKSIAIIAILLLIAGAAYARMTVIGIAGMVAAPAGGGDTLVGKTTDGTGDSDMVNPDEAIANKNTAVKSGDIAKGYARIKGAFGTINVKMVVWDSGGDVVAVSSAESVTDTMSEVEFTFSSGSITQGNTYYVGFISDGYPVFRESGSAWDAWGNSNSYSSPASIGADGGGMGYATPTAYVVD